MEISKKEIARKFLSLVIEGKIREAFERHVAPHFKHHNPHSVGDAASLLRGMEENEAIFPGKKFEIKRIA